MCPRGTSHACPVHHCQYSAVFVLLFTASDAGLNSAVVFCPSWNSFVDSTGIFLNLGLYSAQSVFLFSVMSEILCLPSFVDTKYHFLKFYFILFPRENCFLKKKVFHQVSRQCSFLSRAAESFVSSHFCLFSPRYIARGLSRPSICQQLGL